MKRQNFLLARFQAWRVKHLSEQQYIYLLSIVVGFAAAVAAIIIKKSAHLIEYLLTSWLASRYDYFLFMFYPAVGILLAVLFMRYVVKQEPGHGIPGVLHAIARRNGLIRFHNTYSAIISSALTVGFGGSVGLEGPTVSTGAAVGSNIGQLLRLNHRQIILMIGLASAAAMAAIFQSPVAAIVFALEVMAIDLAVSSMVPLLIATLTAVITSYFVLGQAVMYPLQQGMRFDPHHTLYFIGLGLLAGLLSVHFSKVMMQVEAFFAHRISKWQQRFVLGSLGLGLLIFLFPALYGEGYHSINSVLRGEYASLYERSLFAGADHSLWFTLILLGLLLLLKPLASAFTFAAGGVGGIFAPALFMGAFLGLFYATVTSYFTNTGIHPGIFAAVGMAGMISGILHAPLTGFFLIAEITGGYTLFIPLMIVSTISFALARTIVPNSVYTYQLAKRGELITHNKDRSVLSMMKVGHLIETNFHPIHPGRTLGDLVKIIGSSKRNIFPVVDKEGRFLGHILLDDIRQIMFDRELYDTPVESIMVFPENVIHPDDPMEEVAAKFQNSGKYNIVVLDGDRYLGYVSRANVFLTYRRKLSDLSQD